jgi:hypothetical protein
VLLAIARAAESGAIAVRPEKVYAVAEVLEIADERRIAAGLGQKRIHQLYQCTEGFLAHTCEEVRAASQRGRRAHRANSWATAGSRPS